ncbi:hypothetical protein RJ639_008855 [Escallonia herrerae]|uniref:Integrase catalytic domain-containing protein n=1 Tax=Escallonia herrerae TaxID=1293975 RepID=A0AA88VNW4_9ASTE|nr:hypothetical protein RJ639_008855 [Escallonia herrerae]
MDVIGPFTTPSSKGHRYILTTTDYFSKWAEAVTLKDIHRETIADFIKTHIIYRFGIPESMIADNAKYFKEGALYKLYAKYNIKYNHSSMYHVPANGLAEAFNKTLAMQVWKLHTLFEKKSDSFFGSTSTEGVMQLLRRIKIPQSIMWKLCALQAFYPSHSPFLNPGRLHARHVERILRFARIEEVYFEAKVQGMKV